MNAVKSSIRSDMFIVKARRAISSSVRSGMSMAGRYGTNMPLLTELGECVGGLACYKHAAPSGASAPGGGLERPQALQIFRNFVYEF